MRRSPSLDRSVHAASRTTASAPRPPPADGTAPTRHTKNSSLPALLSRYRSDDEPRCSAPGAHAGANHRSAWIPAEWPCTTAAHSTAAVAFDVVAAVLPSSSPRAAAAADTRQMRTQVSSAPLATYRTPAVADPSPISRDGEAKEEKEEASAFTSLPWPPPTAPPSTLSLAEPCECTRRRASRAVSASTTRSWAGSWRGETAAKGRWAPPHGMRATGGPEGEQEAEEARAR